MLHHLDVYHRAPCSAVWLDLYTSAGVLDRSIYLSEPGCVARPRCVLSLGDSIPYWDLDTDGLISCSTDKVRR